MGTRGQQASRKSKPTAADVAAAKRLRQAWDGRADKSLTQEKMGQLMGGSQALVNQYLNGRIGLNYRALLHFASALGIDPETIRNDLPEQQVDTAFGSKPRGVAEESGHYALSQVPRLDPETITVATRALVIVLKRRGQTLNLETIEDAALFAAAYDAAASMDDELQLGAVVADLVAEREARRGRTGEQAGGDDRSKAGKKRAAG